MEFFFIKRRYSFLKIQSTNHKEVYKVEIKSPHRLTLFSSAHPT